MPETVDAIAGQPVYLRIFKEEAELELWQVQQNQLVLTNTYDICTFSGKLGPKLAEGDLQAPEGFYFVSQSALNPNSRYHLSFNIGYPNAYDRAYGRTGSLIMVHGDCVSIGCFAMTDPVIEEIYRLVEQALNADQSFVRVHVFPFRMTEENIEMHSGSKWISFWHNLKEGYDHFEKHGLPPSVDVSDKHYIFSRITVAEL